MRALPLLALIACVACAFDPSGTSSPDEGAWFPDEPDAASPEDDPTSLGPDAPPPQPPPADAGAGPADAAPPDAAPGKPFGRSCRTDSECASGLCATVKGDDVCTLPCTDDSDCPSDACHGSGVCDPSPGSD
jgi:hypothetical protein